MAEHDPEHEHPHKHPPQPDHPEPSSHHELMGVALNELLIEKGVYTATELRHRIARIEAVEPATHGARVIARAWADPGFGMIWGTHYFHPAEACPAHGLKAVPIIFPRSK